jgi:hypothetical protein
MPRERWFYAKDLRRVGPLPRRQLVESLLARPDARACLIWRHGLPAWTPAREVPEIDRQLASFIKAEPAPAHEPALSAVPSLATPGGEAAAERALRVPGQTSARAARGGQRLQPPKVALYLAGLAALLVVVVVAWLLWPRSTDNEGPASALGAGAAKSGGAPLASPATGEAPSTGRGPGAGTPGFAGWSDQEAELPLAELRRLRGVGGWSGDRLTITLYNGSTWRITEILVRTSRLRGDEFVDGATPHRLLPVGGAPLDAATAELLKKVAPDRKKAGVNPLDTGPFEATVGPQPEAYRWKIEGARGYPPRS